ncbi:hypothetical protein PVL29_012231 [Vitis rotundifolia]|uniref:Uncharacterized protein n=1 Tax=Vitis rotundifolia TaxID=103349 RepID=A0AA38ZQF6_VITRO|nr:hypothetical protein PVL29_012231 [Vitis rotundifolia]
MKPIAAGGEGEDTSLITAEDEAKPVVKMGLSQTCSSFEKEISSLLLEFDLTFEVVGDRALRNHVSFVMPNHLNSHAAHLSHLLDWKCQYLTLHLVDFSFGSTDNSGALGFSSLVLSMLSFPFFTLCPITVWESYTLDLSANISTASVIQKEVSLGKGLCCRILLFVLGMKRKTLSTGQLK